MIVSELGQQAINIGAHDSQIEILSTGQVKARIFNLGTLTLGTVAFGTWHHVALSYNQATSTMTGFLDGVATATTVGTRTPPATGQLYYALGPSDGTNLGSGANFNGLIDEFRVWNVARTQVQIQSTMSQTLSGTELGLVADYRFNESSGLGVFDLTPNGYTGFIQRGGADSMMNAPVLTSAILSGANLTLTGYAAPGAAIDFFSAAPDPSGFGQAQTYLTTLIEGAPLDTDTSSGSYNLAGIGAETANKFSFTIAVPVGVGVGAVLTATATVAGVTSEFSHDFNVKSADAAPSVNSLSLSNSSGTATSTFNENDVVTLTGQFTDADLQDTHKIVVNWGDGTSSTLATGGAVFGTPSPATTFTDPTTGKTNTYLVLKNALNWYQAETDAQALGGTLVTIHDAAENTFVTNLLYNQLGANNPSWLGLYNAPEEGVFRWADGEPLSFRNGTPASRTISSRSAVRTL